MKKSDFYKPNIMRDERIDYWLNEFGQYEEQIEKIKQRKNENPIWTISAIDKILVRLTALKTKATEYLRKQEKIRDDILMHPNGIDKNQVDIAIKLVDTWLRIKLDFSNEIEEIKGIKNELVSNTISVITNTPSQDR